MRKDRTAEEKLTTAQDIVQLLKDKIAKSSLTAKQRREAKKDDEAATGANPRKQARSHPVASIQEEPAVPSFPDSETDSVETALLEAVEDLCFASQSESLIYMPVLLNGVPAEGMADIGSFQSLISAEKARKLGLELTAETRSFYGVGEGVGCATKPVEVRRPAQGKSTSIQFFAIEGLRLPIVIGLEALGNLGVVVDCAKREVSPALPVAPVKDPPAVSSVVPPTASAAERVQTAQVGISEERPRLTQLLLEYVDT